MGEWVNPYAELQHSLRLVMRDRLRRSSGSITMDAFMSCAASGRDSAAAKMALRLLHHGGDGILEWKTEIASEEALLQRIGGSKAIRVDEVVKLWRSSRQLALRTAYPMLAPAGNRSQHVKRSLFGPSPVYGVDVLVRPLTEFSEDRDGSASRNALSVGADCFALVIHGDFNHGALVRESEFDVRLVVGDSLRIRNIVVELIPKYAWRCEVAIRSALLHGDSAGAIDAVLPHLAEFANAATNAFYL